MGYTWKANALMPAAICHSPGDAVEAADASWRERYRGMRVRWLSRRGMMWGLTWRRLVIEWLVDWLNIMLSCTMPTVAAAGSAWPSLDLAAVKRKGSAPPARIPKVSLLATEKIMD